MVILASRTPSPCACRPGSRAAVGARDVQVLLAALQGLTVCITRWPGTVTGTPQATFLRGSEVRTSSRGQSPVSPLL